MLAKPIVFPVWKSIDSPFVINFLKLIGTTCAMLSYTTITTEARLSAHFNRLTDDSTDNDMDIVRS